MLHTTSDARDIILENELTAVEEFRAMPNEALLALWEQLQNMEMELKNRFGGHVTVAPNYEKIILDELSFRSFNNEIFATEPVLRKKTKKPQRKRVSPSIKYIR